MKVNFFLHVQGTDSPVCIERLIDLPFAPWIGLEIFGLTNECSEMCDHTVEYLWWNTTDESFHVRLAADDSDDTGRTSQQIVDEDYPSEWIQSL